MDTDLSRVYALVAGCEDYPMDGWTLDGPVHDALDIGKWLLQTGIPARNLHLLANPLPANQAEFDAERAALGDAVFHGPATSVTVKKVFQERLPQAIKADGRLKAKGLLLVFWSGHGIVQRHHAGFDRIVFCTDAVAKAMECVALPAIADWLESELPTFKLIFLVDACASESSKLRVDTRLSFLGMAAGTVRGTPERFFAYAAYPGQVARNHTGKQRGLFTGALLDHLKDFRPASIQDFDRIDRIVDLACETVNAASAGRQSVVWDKVGWKGHRERTLADEDEPSHQPKQAPPAESAAALCDRKRQWAEFERLAKLHQQRHPRRPMLVITHGRRDQDYSAFLGNLSHRVRSSRLWSGSVSTLEHFFMLDHWTDLAQAELDEQLVARLGALVQMTAQPSKNELAARLGARRSTWMLMTLVESQLLRKDPYATLAPLLRFWHAFPDLDDSALVVLIHIEYPPAPRSLAARLFSRLIDPDRAVRAAVAAQDWSLPAACLPTELGMVTMDDVAQWAREIHSIHRGWGRPTEREIQALFEPHQQRAMDEIVKQLTWFLQKGKFHANSQAC